jgi:hypothetical protein
VFEDVVAGGGGPAQALLFAFDVFGFDVLVVVGVGEVGFL